MMLIKMSGVVKICEQAGNHTYLLPVRVKQSRKRERHHLISGQSRWALQVVSKRNPLLKYHLRTPAVRSDASGAHCTLCGVQGRLALGTTDGRTPPKLGVGGALFVWGGTSVLEMVGPARRVCLVASGIDLINVLVSELRELSLPLNSVMSLVFSSWETVWHIHPHPLILSKRRGHLGQHAVTGTFTGYRAFNGCCSHSCYRMEVECAASLSNGSTWPEYEGYTLWSPVCIPFPCWEISFPSAQSRWWSTLMGLKDSKAIQITFLSDPLRHKLFCRIWYSLRG